MKQKFIDAYMDVAHRFAQLSSAKRLKVGAIIVKDDRIISIGYNGMPSGWTNECETKEYMSDDAGGWLSPDEIEQRWPFKEKLELVDANEGSVMITRRYALKTKDEVIHAEANAIAKLAKCTESGDGSTMFLTHAPCIHCAKQIYTAGIKTVYFDSAYRDDVGLTFLKKCDILVNQVGK